MATTTKQVMSHEEERDPPLTFCTYIKDQGNTVEASNWPGGDG